MTTHRCQFCDSDYPCHSFVEGEDENHRQRWACDCKSTDECPGCSEHGACEDCGQASAGDERSMFRCTPCADVWMDNYEPPEPDLNDVSAGERMADGYRVMAERRK